MYWQKNGAKVLLVARRNGVLQSLKKQIPDSFVYAMDVADKISVQAAFDRIEGDKHRIDICINSAGIGKLTPIFEASSHEYFESIMQTNVMGTWYVTQAAAIHMKNHSIHGSIIILFFKSSKTPAYRGLSTVSRT